MTDSSSMINIERAILSSILFDYELFEDLSLESNDFYLPAHQLIFQCMKDLFLENMPIDEEFLRRKLSTKKVDDSILIEILTANAITNISAYENQIKEDSKRRKLASLATTIKKVSIEEEIPVAKAIDTVQKELNEIDNDIAKTRTIADIVSAFDLKVQEAAKTKGPIGLKTSISYLNNVIGAFEPGKVIVLGARPSMGKTALACNFTNDFLNTSLNKNAGVLWDSLEMSAEDIIKRLIACKNHESLTDLKKGLVRNYDKYHKSLKFYATHKSLHINDKQGRTPAQIIANARKIFRKAQKDGNPINAWFLDHLDEMALDPKNKRIELGNAVKDMRALAKEFGVAFFPLSQLNRDVTNRKTLRPQLSDLKESGAIEETADIVIFPHREDYYKRADKSQQEQPISEAELIIPKNRDGQAGIVKTMFNGPFNLFGKEDIPVEVVFENISAQDEDTGSIDVPDIL